MYNVRKTIVYWALFDMITLKEYRDAACNLWFNTPPGQMTKWRLICKDEAQRKWLEGIQCYQRCLINLYNHQKGTN